MKTKSLILSIFILVTGFASAQKIINSPSFESANYSAALQIEQIELTDSATILRMKINYAANKFWSINKESYILVDGSVKKRMVTKADGIDLGERMYTKNGTSVFALYFPPIDTNANKLDFIESDCNSCFRIKGVDLTGKTITTLSSNNDYIPVKSPDNKTQTNTGSSKSNDNEVVAPESSAIYDGSSYNIIFAWKKKQKANKPHWTGMGMALANFNGMDDTNADLSISTSYSFIINTTDYKVPLSSHLLLITGMGLDFTRYHFNGNVGLTVVDGITKFVESADETYKSSKLITYYITIPLLLEYQTKIANNRTFYVSGGMVGYIKYYSKSQIDVNVDGGVQARSLGRDLNILPVNGRLMLQTGISDVNFYAYYSPFSLFQKDKGPDLKPIGIGIMIGF